MNLPIERAILQGSALDSLIHDAEHLGSFEYRGLTITLYQPNVPNMRIACIVGLGNQLYMVYQFKDPENAGMPMSEMHMFFEDFQAYVITEATHATKH